MNVTRIPYLGKDMRTESVVPVVLVYLIGYVLDEPYVLLMRRGEKVAYMKDMWSIIAGVKNGDAEIDTQAYVEIAGETSLLRTEIGRSSPVGVFEDVDLAAGKTWVRHLMIATINYTVDDPAKFGVRLDWEHKEAAWMPVRYILDWLDGRAPGEPTADAILLAEPHTPDFKLNFERARTKLQKLVS